MRKHLFRRSVIANIRDNQFMPGLFDEMIQFTGNPGVMG